MSKLRHLLLMQAVKKEDDNNDEILPYTAQTIAKFNEDPTELQTEYPYFMIMKRGGTFMFFVSKVPQYVRAVSGGVTQIFAPDETKTQTGDVLHQQYLQQCSANNTITYLDGHRYSDYNVTRTEDVFLWCSYDLYYWEGTAPTTKLYRKKG